MLLAQRLAPTPLVQRAAFSTASPCSSWYRVSSGFASGARGPSFLGQRRAMLSLSYGAAVKHTQHGRADVPYEGVLDLRVVFQEARAVLPEMGGVGLKPEVAAGRTVSHTVCPQVCATSCARLRARSGCLSQLVSRMTVNFAFSLLRGACAANGWLSFCFRTPMCFL